MHAMGLSLTRTMSLANKVTDMARWPYERLSKVEHLTKMASIVTSCKKSRHVRDFLRLQILFRGYMYNCR